MKRTKKTDATAIGTKIGRHSLTTSELKRGLQAAGLEEGTEDWSQALRAGRAIMSRIHEEDGTIYCLGPNED